MRKLPIQLPQEQVANFCHRWHIKEFALFGSILRDDFRLDSDIDVLVTFEADTQWGLLAHVQLFWVKLLSVCLLSFVGNIQRSLGQKLPG